MPLTRSAFQRYRLIDEAISRYPYQYSKKRLYELCRDRCGIRSMSTLEKDIQTLREDHHAPIAYCKKRNGYYYLEPSFRLLKLMLTPDDMEAFERATEVLRATQGTASAQELMGALQKVRQSLDLIREVTTEPADAKAVYVEDTTLGGNRQYVSVLIRAINKGRQVQFDYRKHDGEGSKCHVLHPLKLREVQDTWYLIGYEAAAGREKTFGLDRISNLSVTQEPCDVPEAVIQKVDQLFTYIYGITDSDGPVEEIWLSFTPRRGKYVKAKPIHQSQQVVEDTATQCIIRLTLIPNRDLMTHLRSYGPDVKILKPKSLAIALKDDLEATLARYAG